MFDGGDIWTPILLTIQLAAATTLILLVLGTPLAWWLARSTARWNSTPPPSPAAR